MSSNSEPKTRGSLLDASSVTPPDISIEQARKKSRSRWGPPVLPAEAVLVPAEPSVAAPASPPSFTTTTVEETFAPPVSCSNGTVVQEPPSPDDGELLTLPTLGARRKSCRGGITISLSATNIAALAADPPPPTAEDGSHITPDALHTDEKGADHRADGYYRGGISSMVADKYRVMAYIGKGVFASVFRGVNVKTGEDVALKIIRNVTSAGRSGDVEVLALRRLQNGKSHADPSHGRHFIVKLIDDLDYRGHKILVLERIHSSVRVACKHNLCKSFDGSPSTRMDRKIGMPGGGMQPKVVLTCARQMLEAFRHMHALDVMHLDIKPDNILVNEDYTHFKLCDFGAAVSTADATQLSVLGVDIGARYYRAPELALSYGCVSPAADIWALGVTIAEMCSGKILFTGKTNNEIIWNIMSVLGPVPRAMAADCHRSNFFGRNEKEYFYLQKSVGETDDQPMTESVAVVMPRPDRAMASELLLKRILPACLSGNTTTGSVDKSQFAGIRDLLLNKMLCLNPAVRATAKRACLDTVIVPMDRVVHALVVADRSRK